MHAFSLILGDEHKQTGTFDRPRFWEAKSSNNVCVYNNILECGHDMNVTILKIIKLVCKQTIALIPTA